MENNNKSDILKNQENTQPNTGIKQNLQKENDDKMEKSDNDLKGVTDGCKSDQQIPQAAEDTKSKPDGPDTATSTTLPTISPETASKPVAKAEDEEEDEVKLSEYVESMKYQNKLENQLASNLEKNDSRLNQCTYSLAGGLKTPETEPSEAEAAGKDPYFYQQVFSCRTCYEDQVKEKIEKQGKEDLQVASIADKASQSLERDGVKSLPVNSVEKLEETDAMKFLKMTSKEQDVQLEKVTNLQIRDKYKIKPHGFCLGCMLVCHEGHEVNELYSKLDFRCDCGNSRFPKSCQLNNDKDYDNNKNVYNQTYYDLYCHCSMPHNQELIDNNKMYMLQCFQCEDWYHNTHLHPKTTSTSIEDQYLLICRKCLSKSEYRTAIMEYRQHFYPQIRSFVSNLEIMGHYLPLAQNLPKEQKHYEQPQTIKRLKLSETEESIILKSATQLGNPPRHAYDLDIIIDDAFLKNLKKEHEHIFSKISKMVYTMENLNEEEKDLLQNLDGIVVEEKESPQNPEEKEDTKRGKISGRKNGPEYNEDYFSKIFNQTMEKYKQGQIAGQLRSGMSNLEQRNGTLSHASQMYIAENLAMFKKKFLNLLKEAEISGQVITKERIQQFFMELNLEKDKIQGKNV